MANLLVLCLFYMLCLLPTSTVTQPTAETCGCSENTELFTMKAEAIFNKIIDINVKLASQAQEIAQLKSDNEKQGQEIVQLKTMIANQTANGGAVYTRWGRTTCPTTTDLVYAGVVGGGQHNQPGGSSLHVCLPKTPQWGKYNDAAAAYPALLYGAEYQMPLSATDNFPFSSTNSNGALQDGNIPCAVCQNFQKSTAMMIPARKQCMGDWNLEYSGYLMGSYKTHQNTNYICIDEAPEQEAGGSPNQDGDVLYIVEGVCGSLPCPPYVNGRELTCAVCTK